MAWKKYMSSAKIFIYRPHNQFTNQITSLCDGNDHCKYRINVAKPVCGNQMKPTTLRFICTEGKRTWKWHSIHLQIYPYGLFSLPDPSFPFRFRLRTKWLHCTMQNFSHCSESVSDSHRKCWYRNEIGIWICICIDLWMQIKGFPPSLPQRNAPKKCLYLPLRISAISPFTLGPKTNQFTK